MSLTCKSRDQCHLQVAACSRYICRLNSLGAKRLGMSRDLKLAAAVYFLAFLAHGTALGEEHLSAEDVLRRHLDSIGTESVRSAAKTRVVEGTTSYRVLVGGAGLADGKAVMVSDRRKIQLLLKINVPRYAGERFICDGDKVSVAGTYADKSRSEFGQFLIGNVLPLREGLLGGVLSTGWPLLELNARKSKLKYQGLKKVDGVDLHAVSYQPKGTSDMEITLYFDPETFRHVRTVYTASAHAGLGRDAAPDRLAAPSEIGTLAGSTGSDVNTARVEQSRYRIEERFSDFKSVDGLTLPSRYDLRFQEELRNGFTKTVEWDTTATQVLNNVPVDARNFQVQ